MPQLGSSSWPGRCQVRSHPLEQAYRSARRIRTREGRPGLPPAISRRFDKRHLRPLLRADAVHEATFYCPRWAQAASEALFRGGFEREAQDHRHGCRVPRVSQLPSSLHQCAPSASRQLGPPRCTSWTRLGSLTTHRGRAPRPSGRPGATPRPGSLPILDLSAPGVAALSDTR